MIGKKRSKSNDGGGYGNPYKTFYSTYTNNYSLGSPTTCDSMDNNGMCTYKKSGCYQEECKGRLCSYYTDAKKECIIIETKVKPQNSRYSSFTAYNNYQIYQAKNPKMKEICLNDKCIYRVGKLCHNSKSHLFHKECETSCENIESNKRNVIKPTQRIGDCKYFHKGGCHYSEKGYRSYFYYSSACSCTLALGFICKYFTAKSVVVRPEKPIKKLQENPIECNKKRKKKKNSKKNQNKS